MRNLIAFLTRHFHWLLFIVMEAVGCMLLFKYNSYHGSVWISSANTVAGRVYSGRASIEQYFALKQLNQELTQRNLILERQLDIARGQLADLTRDTTALERAEMSLLSQYSLVAAKVVANSVSSPDNLITIDRGRADGVSPDMGVASGGGVVGVVYLCGEHYSVVLPVLNRRSRVSCAIRGTDYFGYLTWKGGDPAYAYVDEVPRHAKFRKGDWVETSGYSSIFPHGVSVGRIEKVFNSDDGLSYRLLVHLSTDFGCLRDVCVITDKTIAERVRLEEAARDSMMLNGHSD